MVCDSNNNKSNKKCSDNFNGGNSSCQVKVSSHTHIYKHTRIQHDSNNNLCIHEKFMHATMPTKTITMENVWRADTCELHADALRR